MYQKITLIGRITEPKRASSKAGNTVLSFGLAVQPNKEAKTEWFNCSVVGKFADTMSNIAEKGQLVFVEAQASTSEGTDGRKYTTHFIQTMRVLSSSSNGSNANNGNSQSHPSGDFDAPF